MANQHVIKKPIIRQIGLSQISLTTQELTITIPHYFWSNRQWNRLVNFMFQIVTTGLNWITAPSTGSNSFDAEGLPRWKRMTIDGLSSLLFALFVKSDNPLRQLFTVIDWNKIDERCASVYRNQKRGAPAYPPQVLFRILVLMFVSGTPFESSTLRRLETDISWRWFAGLSMLVDIPNAGTLSYFRTRLGVELFETILIDLIKVCDETGLIGHVEFYYDMTGVEASATQVTPYQRAVILTKSLSTYLDKEQGGIGQIDKEQLAKIALETLSDMHPSLEKIEASLIVHSLNHQEKRGPTEPTEQTEPTKSTKPTNSAWWQRITQKIAELNQSETPKPTIEHLRQIATKLIPVLPKAFGDPDASVGHTRTDGTICGYRSGFLVDAKNFIITAVVFLTLSKPEAPSFITAVDKYHAIFGKYPINIGLDSAFYCDEVHQYTEEHNIYAAITIRSRPGAAGVFHTDRFVWDETEQLFCPNNEVMKPIRAPYKDGTERYQCQGQCSQCPLLTQCLSEKQQEKNEVKRELRINTETHQRAQRSRERSLHPKGRAIRRQRFASEGVFGHLNHFHNGDKAPYRNEDMNHIAQLMVAFVHNLEKLEKFAKKA